MESTPYLLAALPQLEDEIFYRAVVLIVHHDEEGAFGFILNKPFTGEEEEATQLVAEIQDQQGSTLFEFEEPLFQGGPSKEEMVFLMHNQKALGDEEGKVTDEIFITADSDVFQDVLTQSEEGQKSFFMGCSSWDAGQLDDEIQNGAWIMVPFEERHLFRVPPDDLGDWSEGFWAEVLRVAGVDPLTLMTQGENEFGPN
ncbi:hypothetical protein GW916_10245 [bacterium]|nr:hypothetical protein [bacterium]